MVEIYVTFQRTVVFAKNESGRCRFSGRLPKRTKQLNQSKKNFASRKKVSFRMKNSSGNRENHSTAADLI